MPLAFEDFQGKGGLDFSSSDSFLTTTPEEQNQTQQQQHNWLLLNNKNNQFSCYVGSNTTTEPTSVLDTTRSPSSPTSSSTLSYNTTTHGGGTTTGAGGGGGGEGEKCGLVMEDWEDLLSGSPGNQEPSILGLIMGGDVDDDDDTSMGLNKILQPVSGSIMTSCQDVDFNGVGFGVVDQANFGFESIVDSVGNPNNLFCSSGSNLAAIEGFEEKPQIFNPQVLINQNQSQFGQNPGFFFPVEGHSYVLSQPPAKRINFGPNHVPQQMFRQQQQQQQIHMFQQRPGMAGMGVMATTTATTAKQKMVSEEFVNQQLQQAVFDQVLKAAELIETGNLVLAQGILARLNHQLSHIGKPFQRAAFYFKEALQSIINNNSTGTKSSSSSCFSVVFKIGAYKSFSEISPILQFANFTCNQALLEAFEGCDRIHIVDFDIGYGGQWASLMQELVMRADGPPSSFRITAFASSSTHDELELGFTQENLTHFATELNIPFELEVANLDSFNSMPIRELENQVLAVNLPIGAFSNYPTTLPLVLRFVKQLSPKIIVSLDRGCDRTDLPFPLHIIHALQSYSGLLESLDAVNVNLDALQKIERFLIHPNVEKIVLGRHRSPERLPPWKSLFMQSGFSPITFSNFAESQADCLVQRTPVRGFRVEKRQSSLVLCWQRKDLISASAWRC